MKRSYLSLVHQGGPNPYTIFFEADKCFHSLEFTCGKSKVCIGGFWIQKMSQFSNWQSPSLHWVVQRPIGSTTLCVQPLQPITLIFWKEPSFLSLWLWHFVSEPELQKYQQRQVKKSRCLERLPFYDAVDVQSLTVKLQFLHNPISKTENLNA